MHTISLIIDEAAKKLQQSHIFTARLDAELLLKHVLGKSREWLVAHGDEEIEKSKVEKFERLIERRLNREPVAYIIGKKEFYGREFTVTPAVLIPRPETESLIDLALESEISGTLLDVGCGSGCIGITLALEVPGLNVTLSDISAEALDVAQKNAYKLGAHHVLTSQSDLLSQWLGRTTATPFNVITANLPYVDHNWERSPETEHEPALALFADNNGLELIMKLIQQTPQLLAPNGLLFLEADPQQHPAIITHAASVGFHHQATNGYAIGLRFQA